MSASLASLGASSDKLDTQQGFSVDSQALLRLRLATVGILDQQIFQDDDQSNVASTRSSQLQSITTPFWGSQKNFLLSQNTEEWSTEQRWLHRSSRCCYYWKCSLFIHDTDCSEEFQVQSQILTFGEPLKTSDRGHRGCCHWSSMPGLQHLPSDSDHSRIPNQHLESHRKSHGHSR